MPHIDSLEAAMTPLAELYDADVIITPEGEVAWVAAVLHGPYGRKIHAFPGAGPGLHTDGFSTSLPEFSLPPESVVVVSAGTPPHSPAIWALPSGKIRRSFRLAGVNAAKIKVEWKFPEDFDFSRQSDAVHFVLDDGRLYHVVSGRFIPSSANSEEAGSDYNTVSVDDYMANKGCTDWPLLTLTELSEDPGLG